MALSFLLHFDDGFFNNWIKKTLSFLQSKIGHAMTKTPYLCTHQFCRMATSICRMNWHSASSKSVGIVVVRRWICSITERILHWFQNTLHFLSIFMPDNHLSQGTSLRRQHCGRFNAVNISYNTSKSTKTPIVLQNHLANVQKNQTCLSNGIMWLITRISKFSCCLYSVKIVCIRSDSVYP